MATQTTNLSLTKPGSSDNVNISVLNTNFDTIDAAIGKTQSLSVSLEANGWSATAPYTYAKSITGMLDTWVPGVPTYNFAGSTPTADALNAALEEMAKIKMIVSSTNTLTFYAPDDKPTAAISMIIPGQFVKGA